MLQPQAKEYIQPPEAGKGEKQTFTWSLQKESNSTETLTWTPQDSFRT
jgi:hypothetical protein